MPSGTYTYTLYTISGSANFNFTVTGSFTVTVFDPDDNFGVGDDSIKNGAQVTSSETGAAPVIQSLGAGAPAGWNVGDTFFFGGARGIDLGSPADDVLVPRVAGDWQNSALYSLPGASVPLVVGQSYSTQGASDNVHQEVVPCFVKGTMIKTACGEVPIERLVKGDLVFTQDAGYQPVVWVGTKTVPVNENTAPIRFEVGSVGNDRPLMVSPNHRMLVRSLHAELLFGSSEVLVCAKHLTKLSGVTRSWPEHVTYVHVLFESHQIICANGAMSESFHPGKEALSALEHETRQEVLNLFPELAQDDTFKAMTARTCLKSYETSALMETVH